MDDQPTPEMPQTTLNTETEPTNSAAPQPVDESVLPPKRSHKTKLLASLFLVLILCAAGYMYINRPIAAVSQITATPTVSTQSLCFVRLSHLDCVDTNGQNRIRYDLPSLPTKQSITSLSAMADGRKFVAISSGQTATSVNVLNEKLESIKTIKFPSGLTANTPALSRDGKAVLLELSGTDNNRQIYRYTIATEKFDKLTSEGYNSSPHETKDGHIVYACYDGTTDWKMCIMNADATQKHQLTTQSQTLGSYYDQTSDTVFVFVNSASAQKLLYGTITDFLAGKPPKSASIAVNSSATQVVRMGADKAVVGSTIYQLSAAHKIGSIDKFGPVVGVIPTNNFHKSTQQTESPYERIANLESTPKDFQDFIKQQFDKADATCKSAGGEGFEYGMRIQKVVRDSFAQVGQGCEYGAVYYYVKTNDVWALAFSSQMAPDCATVNKYKFTKEIIAQCYNGNQAVDNVNP